MPPERVDVEKVFQYKRAHIEFKLWKGSSATFLLFDQKEWMQYEV